MTIAKGAKIGSYKILAAIGAGGMGEVYRARDAKLGRDVAIKVLPASFARDGERMARFGREAKVLASLNHPNIAAIYGFEDSGGAHALVTKAIQPVRDDWINVFPCWSSDSQHVIYFSDNLGEKTEYGAIRTDPLSGGAPDTIVKELSDLFPDVAPDGRLLFRNAKNQVEIFDPGNHSTEIHDTAHPSDGSKPLRWSPDGLSIAYVVHARTEGDPNAGLWVEDFKSSPRQIFHGWVDTYAVRPGGEIYIVQGEPDLNGVIWRVRWDGQGLTRLSATLPMAHDYYVDPLLNPADYLAASPDGRYVAAGHLAILAANIGMIKNAR